MNGSQHHERLFRFTDAQATYPQITDGSFHVVTNRSTPGNAWAMERVESLPIQFGLRVILLVISAFSLLLALAAQGHLATAIFLVCMPLWTWMCLQLAIGCIIVVSSNLDALERRHAHGVGVPRCWFRFSLIRLLGLVSVACVFLALVGQVPLEVTLVIGSLSLYLLAIARFEYPFARFAIRLAKTHGKTTARLLEWVLATAVAIGLFVVPFGAIVLFGMVLFID